MWWAQLDCLQVLHNLGLRKFFLGGIGPLGCIPNQLATGLSPPGKCVAFVNDYVGMFNMRLRSLVDQFNRDYQGSIFVYGNTFGALSDIIANASTYGKSIVTLPACLQSSLFRVFWVTIRNNLCWNSLCNHKWGQILLCITNIFNYSPFATSTFILNSWIIFNYPIFWLYSPKF